MSFYEEIGVLLHRNFRMGKTTVELHIESVKFYADSQNVEIRFKEKIPGMEENEETGKIEQVEEVQKISLKSSYLTAVLSELDDQFGDYRGMLGHRLEQAQWSGILRKSVLKVTREFHNEGDVLEDGTVFDHDGYATSVLAVKFRDKAVQLMENACDELFLK